MDSPAVLSVIVVSFNSSSFLPDCLSSVFAQESSFPVEVIAVDNASTDNSPEIIDRRFPRARVIRNETNRGFAAANNQGIVVAAGKYLLLLNPDTVLHADCLEHLVQFMDEHPEAGAAGPKIFNPDGSLQRTGVAFPSLWNVFVELPFLDALFPSSTIFGRQRRLYESPDVVHDVDCLQGSCLIIRREALEQVGLLDEEYFIYFEETDLCYRLRQREWRVLYDPSASIVHAGGSGSRFYGKRQLVNFHRSYLTFLRKHEPVHRRLAFRILLLLRAAVRMPVFLICAAVSSRRGEFLSRVIGYFLVMLQMFGVKQ
jgi:GT2 family glycosyltransferase